eukprot:746846-Hanusia_phi.AAC.1
MQRDASTAEGTGEGGSEKGRTSRNDEPSREPQRCSDVLLQGCLIRRKTSRSTVPCPALSMQNAGFPLS